MLLVSATPSIVVVGSGGGPGGQEVDRRAEDDVIHGVGRARDVQPVQVELGVLGLSDRGL